MVVLSFHNICAKRKGFFHVACGVEHICLGRNVVYEIDELCLGGAGENGTAIFELSVVGKDAVDDEIDFVLVYAEVAKESVQIVGRHVDVTEQECVFQSLSLHIVLADLAPVVEECGDDTAFYLDVFLIRIYRVDALEEVEHLIDMVDQSARKCVVNTGGCRIFAVFREKFVCLLEDEALQCFVGA